jgi:hypothetical protein
MVNNDTVINSCMGREAFRVGGGKCISYFGNRPALLLLFSFFLRFFIFIRVYIQIVSHNLILITMDFVKLINHVALHHHRLACLQQKIPHEFRGSLAWCL